MLKIVSVALLCNRALSVLDDSSALIQQSHEQREGILGREKICSKKDLEAHEAKLKVFHEAQTAKQKKRDLKAKEKNEAAKAAAYQRGDAFLRPLLDKADLVLKYLEQECRPTGLLIVKSILQQLFAKELVDPQRAIDTNKTVTGFLDRWNKEIAAHQMALFSEGFAALHDKVEEALLEMDPAVQARLNGYNATYPVHNETELRNYVNAKVVPMTMIKALPNGAELARLLATMPANTSEQQAWVQKEVLPTVLKTLPPQCQQGRLLTTLGLGMGDLGTRVGKFVETCKKSLGIEPDEPPPVRKCHTCEELYQKQTFDMTDANGCMLHCMPTVASCAQGVNDACLHKAHPCLRCHKRKLAALDTCLGTDTHASMIEMLGQLSTVMKTATVEQDGVDALLDGFLDAMKL